MATESATHGAEQEVSFGLQEYLAAALSYIPIFGLLMLVVEEDSDFVRFHAAQAVLLAIGLFVLRLGMSIFASVLAAIPVVGTMIGLVTMLVSLAGFLVMVFAAYKAYSGERFGLPVVAGIAKQFV